MESVLERLKKKESEIKEKRNKFTFVKIEEINNRKIYHTKIMNDFYAFGIDEKRNDKFFISFRGLFNQEKIEWFSLFPIKEGDKFLGIFYGYRKPIQNIITRYEHDGVSKTYTFSKVYYIEFRFKNGSVFCYIKGIYRLIRKERLQTTYNNLLLSRMLNLEKEVYEFYNKKLPEGGIITKWIEKNLKQ